MTSRTEARRSGISARGGSSHGTRRPVRVLLARPGGYALDRPLLERGPQGVLRQFLGGADVPGDPGQARDQAGRFDPPHRLDRGPGGLVARFGHGPAGPITWRMSVEPVQPAQWSRCSLMKREAHSMASSFDLTSYSA